MQYQTPDQVTSSEEIYNKMIRATFGEYDLYTTQSEESVTDEGFSTKNSNYSDSKDNLLVQNIVNTLTAQLQAFLPVAFRISPLPKQCLSYANLYSWSPGRSYFSLFEIQQSKSVWILHLSRSAGEGLASLSHSKNSRTYRNIYKDLPEADSVIYLEIAQMLRRIFNSLLELWPASYKLKVARCRHILQLGFLQEISQNEEYVVLPFYLDNKICNGEINFVFPQRYLKKIIGN